MAEQRTFTASTAHATVPSKLIHEGVTPLVGKYVYTPAVAATYTASCVVHLAKVPNKATVLDGYIRGEGEGMSSGFSIYVGSTLVGSPLSTDQTMGRLTSLLPLEVSASASDGNNEYWYISARNLDPFTTTETIAYCFFIAKDGLSNTGRG